jgi:hypothetical protein
MSDCTVPALPLTGKRLGAAAAFTHYLSNPHFPPPLRQTARCAFGHFARVLSVTLHFHCRYCSQFHYFVGLYSISKSATLSATTTLSGCTQFSGQFFVRYHYIFGLYSIFKSVTLSATTTLSGCTRFSSQLLFPLPLHFRAVLNFQVSYFFRHHYIIGLYSIFRSVTLSVSTSLSGCTLL